jgi:hypothetical protein
MRKNVALAAALVTALVAVVPSPTLATVVINIENTVPHSAGTDTVLYLTAFATDVDNSKERLNAYTIAIDGPDFTPDGVRFLVPGSNFGQAGIPTFPRPYVFKDLETVPPIENFSSTYNRLQIGATAVAAEDEVDIDDTHNGLIRIPVFVPANTRFKPVYRLVVDPNATSLAGLGAPILAVPGQPGFIAVVPEPSAAALLLLPSLALLRRRRGQTSGRAA